jgi:hypothetical protein
MSCHEPLSASGDRRLPTAAGYASVPGISLRNNNMRRILLALLLALGLGWGLALPASAQMREGLYSVEGQNPDGSLYQGFLELRPAPGAAWLVAWQIGGSVVQGVGIVQGGVLAVGYGVGNQVGVATYEVQADGKLSGYWTIGDGVGSEVLTPQAAPAAAPAPATPPAR